MHIHCTIKLLFPHFHETMTINSAARLDVYQIDDVKNDSELQNWSEEDHNIALPGFDGIAGVMGKIETNDEFIKFYTLIMFSGDTQHAAIHF